MKARPTTSLIYSSPEYPNGLIGCYSSSSPPSSLYSSPSSSIVMVYADMGSISLNSNYGVVSAVSTSQESYACKGPEMKNGGSSWTFPFMRECLAGNFEEHPKSDVAEGRGSDCSNGFRDNNGKTNHSNVNLNEENPNENSGISGKEAADAGQSKLCARGHWRPAEDSKLKELVALRDFNAVKNHCSNGEACLQFSAAMEKLGMKGKEEGKWVM